ncbi:MAG: DMT family transporter [Planctomycetota bacterium]|nr:DMT family transporter [Planctomycetota bacterium]
MSAGPRHVLGDYVPILTAVLLWGWGTPLYKYMQAHGIDPLTLVFYRVFSSTAVLGAWVCWKRRAALSHVLRRPARFMLMGALFTGGLVAFTAGTYGSTATLSMLITRAIPLISIGLSALLFHDERRLVRRRGFQAGFVLALGGLLGLILLRDPRVAASSTSLVLLLATAVLWGSYSPCAKAWLKGHDAFAVSTLVFALAAALTLPLAAWKGDLAWPAHAPLTPVLVMLASGPVLMGFTEGLFYVSVERLGLAPSTAMTLVVPPLTLLYAWPLLGEEPTLELVLLGGVLIGGLALIVRSRGRLLQELGATVEPVTSREGGGAATAGVVKGKDEV